MTDEPDNLVVSILRDLQGRMARVDRKIDDLRERLDSLSSDHFGIKRDAIRQDEVMAHHVRQDRIEAAVERINVRLGLLDPSIDPKN